MKKRNLLRLFSSRSLLLATVLGGAALAASAAAPKITGYNIEPGSILFPAQCDSIKVYFDRDQVLSATYELRQNGKVVFSGKDDGKSTGLNHSFFSINTTANNNTREICLAMAVEKTLVEGDVEFAVTSVTYLEGDDEVTENNVGSVTWNLTGMPRISGANPMWHPSIDLKELKEGTSVSFTISDANFGSYFDEALNKTVYLKTQVKGGKISLVQDGEVKTVIDIVKPEPTVSAFNPNGMYDHQGLNQKLTAEHLAPLHKGEVEVRLTELTYLSPCDGKEVVASDPEGIPTTWTSLSYSLIPGRAITKVKCVNTTKIESESFTPLESELLSYYPEDGEDGVFTYTFSDPLMAGESGNGDFVVKFRIGDANNTFEHVVPHTLSDDHKTLTIDLRGLPNGLQTLTNNYTFKDDEGNVYIPEKCTICIESGLYDENGVKVSVFCLFDSNIPGRYLDGQLWRTYRYKDISFETPALSNVLFYNSTAPDKKNDTMTAGSNMMDVTVRNSEVIASAQAAYLIGETIVPATATREGDVWSVVIPESVIENGVENLKFTLQNVEYTMVDGNQHIIAPIDLSGLAPAKEYSTLAEILDVEPGTEIVINTQGLLVTMSNEFITAAEDKTAAVLLIDSTTEEAAKFAEGDLLTGTICGTYVGDNMFSLDSSKSDYTVTVADATIGFDVTDMEDCNKLAFRLLTFSAEDGFEFTPIEDDEQIIAMIDDQLPVMDAIGVLADYICPEKIQSITGVYYVLEGNAMLLVRNADDIVAANELPVIENIRALKASEIGKPVAVSLTDAVVTAVFEEQGLALLQDKDCAINLVTEDETEVTFKRGASITGKLVGMYVGNHTFVVDFNESDFTENEADVTYGHTVAIEDIFDTDNQYRLVTFQHSEETPIAIGDNGPQVSENIFFADMFEVLEDMSFEDKKITSLTGILYFPEIQEFVDENEAPAYAFLIPRDANDIITSIGSGMEGILGNFNEDAPVYNLNGVKLREAGEGIKGFAKGIYIVDGKKIFVK